jgi:hypothetical protein
VNVPNEGMFRHHILLRHLGLGYRQSRTDDRRPHRYGEQEHANFAGYRGANRLVTSFSRRVVTRVVFRSREVQTDSLLGNEVKRAAWSVIYLAMGLVVSWGSVLYAGRLASKYSWPLIRSHWHECWDIEHCRVSWFGYAAIFLFIFGPVATWAVVGFYQARRLTVSRVAVAVPILVVGTVLFYICFYAAIWQ